MTEQDVAQRSDDQVVLQRVILPRDTDPVDVRPLYLDELETAHSHVSSRTAVTVPVSARVSFAAFFNAFPAGYWKRWTKVTEVILRVNLRGGGRIDVYRSKPNGDQAHLAGQAVRSGAEWTTAEFRVSLAPFEDGGWIWFDLFTDDSTLELADAVWATELDLPPVKLSIGTTTFNRVDDCVASLLALGEDPAILDVVTKVYVADQGTKKISGHPRFAEAARLLGARLEVIEQGNLGGSGGFSRAFYESIEHSDVDQILLMDDDIALEPDSILRASAFARAATSPMIVGSQMLNLQEKAQLHSMGEVVDLHSCYWRPAPGAVTKHDFGEESLRETPELHRRIDSSYNGWWMCLFPREIVEANGLPLPLFIKWDDAEYSLRALAKGYPTVTLPGSAVWHMPWTDKNDLSDWTVYFHLRNRLVVAALHSPHDQRAVLVKQGMRNTLRRLLSMEYSTVAIEIKAIEDFLAGPDRLFDLLPTALPEIQRIRKQYPDAQTLASASQFPPPSLDAVHAERMLRPPVNPAKIAAQASKALLHNLRPPAPEAADRPQVNVPASSALWFLLGNLDSATVSNPDGSGVAFRRRDPKVFRELSKQAAAAYRRLATEWPAARETWRAAMPELTSTESWRKVFEN
ncbi:glycosyltransferase [Actinokineospora cianjurensis]|uniref:Galactofuranosylgalactofuranosylrhamnosyl-N-acetylglucosaminyl-diphospho-decaprenol beta-1,5/1,6-galactofuranosyltransferase n=1 Tax=Actinokineospora cianjurensis TaxID=585224 RepID=A0A421B755_9PSEU|nr:glycosyltransferase [Actinokineospora cianjurensis]RLK60050.1 galactofuranosylgalactofuranosylrhamnosyl-N-acetylglucosaminyl-diphospho-decaprenol beta-1,5/1,6-galactofuranosyltransferase [Actinokineospora cianjurensis]